MGNKEFLKVISLSFKKFLETGSRSNKKLEILHGSIACDILNRLGDGYSVKSLGIGTGQEAKVDGRYIDKAVDITIFRQNKPVAGIGVKFVMQNYSQNSNNYFENMLGETANIRCNHIPYFQIFIIPEELPYYKKDGTFQKWEVFSKHNSYKYKILSQDNIETSVHTPTKTLLFVIQLPKIQGEIFDRDDYINYYEQRDIDIHIATEPAIKYESAVIYNDYEIFAQKVAYYILSM